MRLNKILALCLLSGCATAPPKAPVKLVSNSSSAGIISPASFAITNISVLTSNVIIEWNGLAGEEVSIQHSFDLLEWETIGNASVSPFVTEKVSDIAFYRLLKTEQELIYAQDFEGRVKPPEWVEWNVFENHVYTWDYPYWINGKPSIAFGSEPLAIAGMCTFAKGEAFNEVWVTFLFRCESFSSQIIEVCDLYDTNVQEICDVYLYPDGLLFLQLMHGAAWCEEPIQAGQDIRIRIHYKTNGVQTLGELWWTFANEEFSNESSRYCAAPGYYKTPIQKFLWGPVHSGGLYAYAEVRVTKNINN